MIDRKRIGHLILIILHQFEELQPGTTIIIIAIDNWFGIFEFKS